MAYSFFAPEYTFFISRTIYSPILQLGGGHYFVCVNYEIMFISCSRRNFEKSFKCYSAFPKELFY